MADIDLSQTGKDVAITLIVDGAPVPLNGQITNWKAKPSIDEIVTKALGTSERKIDQEHGGWDGSFDVDSATPDLQDVSDAIATALVTGVAMSINLLAVERYRNGTSRQYIYPDCKIEMDQTVSRGSATKIAVSWKSGKQRIPR